MRTPSDENSSTIPSSSCQFNLAHVLVDEMKAIGIEDAEVDDQCYVYGHIPATPGYENCTAIGFIAHMDTVADFCDHDIVPVVHENYDGEALALGDSGLTLSPEMFPHLRTLKGRTLITSDGTTILAPMTKRESPKFSPQWKIFRTSLTDRSALLLPRTKRSAPAHLTSM